MSMVNRILASVIILIWFVSCAYFGFGGALKFYETPGNSGKVAVQKVNDSTTTKFIFQDIPFDTAEDRDAYKNWVEITTYYPWLDQLPYFLCLAITASAFGALGGIILLIKQIVLESKKPEDLKYISQPVFGLMTGIAILGLSYVLPTVLVSTDQLLIRPTTLMFLCMFGGLYSERFHANMNRYFDKMFPQKNKDE